MPRDTLLNIQTGYANRPIKQTTQAKKQPAGMADEVARGSRTDFCH
jgi:hypothetical protein